MFQTRTMSIYDSYGLRVAMFIFHGDGTYIDRSHKIYFVVSETFKNLKVLSWGCSVSKDKTYFSEDKLKKEIQDLKCGFFLKTSTESKYNLYSNNCSKIDAIINNNKMVKVCD